MPRGCSGNYGRWCGVLIVGGRDVGPILIVEGARAALCLQGWC